MAYMYPKIEYFAEKTPYAEIKVYKELEKLDQLHSIFHSVNWVRTKKNNTPSWFENDYIILSKKYGILILEVKGGKIWYEDNLFHQQNTKTLEVNVLNQGNDPLTQASRAKKYNYVNRIKAIIPDWKDKMIIEPAVCFPEYEITNESIKNFPQDYRDVSFAIIGHNHMDFLANKVVNIYKDYNAENVKGLSAEEYKAIKKLIAPYYELDYSPSYIKESLENEFIRLTNEQLHLLDYISEQSVATISGAAGTGKTVVATIAAENFAKEGRKVLYLCFNRFLKDFLSETHNDDGVDYCNIHSFINRFSKADLSDPKIRVKELLGIDIDLFDYDDVIIDEAQDLDDQEIDYFKTYVQLKDGHFYAFFDKNQLVLRKCMPKWLQDSECKLVLTRNCRNTKQIARTSYNFVSANINEKYRMPEGTNPVVLFAKGNLPSNVAELVQHYIDNGYKANEITILTLSTEEKSFLNSANAKAAGLNITSSKGKNVLFTTASKFKGLESNVVIIIDITDSCFKDLFLTNDLYVAASRAKHHLAFVIDSNQQDLLTKISDAIDADSEFSEKKTILVKAKAVEYKCDMK